MELKTLKDQLGEPLGWSDYLSLPFTQNVSKYIAEINSLQYITHQNQSIYLTKKKRINLYIMFFTLVILCTGDYRNSKDGKHHNWGDEEGHERC